MAKGSGTVPTGWCMTGYHDACPVETPYYTDSPQCVCECHGEETHENSEN